MNCYNCRAEVKEDELFCSQCGSPQKFTDLVQRALKNDQDATSQLYKMTYNNVYQTICTMANLDDDTVFDLIQNTYIKAFCSLSQLNEPEAFRGWVKVISRNLTIDYLRKKKEITFSQMISVDSDEMIEFEDDRIENLPDVVVDKKETTRLIGEILNQLSEEQRIAVHLYYFEQLSVKEIADILGVSDGTVKSRLNYGRKKIEAGVKELEKKGTKLYGLAPVPFLFALLKSQEIHAAEMPNPAILQAVEKGLSSGLSGSASTSHTINEAGKKAAMTAGRKAAKTTGVAGKTVLTKALAGVVAVAVIGAGAVGIRSMNEDDKDAVKQEEITTEQEAVPQDMKVEDFVGGYTSEYYLFELSYTDNDLRISSAILPGKEIIAYSYDDFQIKGNTLKAKHEELSEDYIVNDDESLTHIPTDGIDTFVFNDDGTVTVTFAGFNKIKSARYNKYEGEGSVYDYVFETAMLELMLGQYTEDTFYCFELSYKNEILSMKSGVIPGREQYASVYFSESDVSDVLDTVSYDYDSFHVEENTLIAYHTEAGENTEINSSEQSDTVDTFVFEGDGYITAAFGGSLGYRSTTYGSYLGEGSVFGD